jgi:hypothetical protein
VQKIGSAWLAWGICVVHLWARSRSLMRQRRLGCASCPLTVTLPPLPTCPLQLSIFSRAGGVLKGDIPISSTSRAWVSGDVSWTVRGFMGVGCGISLLLPQSSSFCAGCVGGVLGEAELAWAQKRTLQILGCGGLFGVCCVCALCACMLQVIGGGKAASKVVFESPASPSASDWVQAINAVVSDLKAGGEWRLCARPQSWREGWA